MERAERQAIEHECRNVVIRLAQLGDRGDAEAGAALFAPEGCWVRAGTLYEGYARILESYSHVATATSVVRHGVLGTDVTVVDADHAEAVTYYCAFRRDASTAEPTLPVPLEVPFAMGEWHDRFTRTEAGWRVQNRTTMRVFQRS